MSKKVDVSFMKICKTDDEWTRDVMDAGGKLLCSAPPAVHSSPTAPKA